MTRVVSLYNVSYQKLLEIDWKHAVILLINGKVAPCTEDEFAEIRTGTGIFKLPLHLALKKYVNIPFKELSPCRKNIFRRDDYNCQYCDVKLNSENATIDHVLPRCRGGKHEWNNVVTCCLKCNRKKGDKTPQEANMPLAKLPKPLRFGQFI
jgi:5-methylcytosine-specific restriction endonuclease McrA